MLHSNRVVLVGEVHTRPSRDANDNVRFDAKLRGCVDNQLRNQSCYEVTVGRSSLADFCETDLRFGDVVCVDGALFFDAFELRIVAGAVVPSLN